MRRHQSSLKKANIRRFHQALERLSLDITPLYIQLGIDRNVVDADNVSMSVVKHLELLELAADQSNNRFLGIEMGLDGRNSELGVLSYMLRNAPDFSKAVDLLNRYAKLASPGSSISLLEEGDQCILTYKILDVSPLHCCQAVEMTMAQFVYLIREALKDDSWQPDRIYFEHPAPEEELLQNFPLGGELIFEHFFSGVSFSRKLMQIPNSNSDPQLLALLESQVRQSAEKLITSDSLLDHIQLLISSNLGNTEVTAGSIATELGMSRRTLHRRLRESGTMFNALRDDIVFRIAKESLCNTSVSIAELAQKLGYSDSSAFNRAFKRVVGQKPLEYRKKHRFK